MNLSRKQFLKTLGLGALALGTKPSGLAGKTLEESRAAARKLRIRDVEIYLFDLPLAAPFRIAIGEMTAANDVLVRVVTDGGLVGIGEACPFPPITGETQATNAAAARAIRDVLVGRDPLAIEGLLREIGAMVHANPSAVAAYDMALYDILGKVAGMPLFRLFGSDRTQFETDVTTGIDATDVVVAETKKHAGWGYKTLKIKVGTDPDADFARLLAVREAIGYDINIRIDANQGWSVPQSIYALRKMDKLRIQLVEQPVVASDIDGLKTIRDASPIPIMADEACYLPADALELVRADACDYFNIKLMKAGGILNAIRIAHIADAADIRCMVGCMLESNVALTAAAHVVASQANIIFADLDGNAEHTLNPVVGGMTVKGGVVTLPETPGLGCDVDPAFLKKLERA
jgi:L-alanine-DL-glutamate epimerase-like enolase superfamily enzyme